MFYLLEKKKKIFVWNTGAFWSAVTLFKPCSSRKVVVTPSPHCNHTPLSVLQPKLFLKGTDQNKEENKGGRGGNTFFPCFLSNEYRFHCPRLSSSPLATTGKWWRQQSCWISAGGECGYGAGGSRARASCSTPSEPCRGCSATSWAGC